MTSSHSHSREALFLVLPFSQSIIGPQQHIYALLVSTNIWFVPPLCEMSLKKPSSFDFLQKKKKNEDPDLSASPLESARTLSDFLTFTYLKMASVTIGGFPIEIKTKIRYLFVCC